MTWESSALPFKCQKRLIKGSDITIFDVGANRGQTAVNYRSYFPNAEIYCFEPFLPVFKEMKSKLSGDKKIHFIPRAVSDANGKTTFHVNKVDHASSLLPHLESARLTYAQQTQRQRTTSVSVVTLDQFILDNDIPAVDILKMDVQGGELRALSGATNLLRRGDVQIVFMEVWGIPHYENSPLLHDVWSFLENYGYSLLNLFDITVAPNGQLRYCDAVFISETLRRVVDKPPKPRKVNK